MKYKNVVWDWNGTLLDDVKVSVDTINVMLERKHLGRLTVEEYRSVFGFPVKPYYESIGFDFSRDDWDAVSRDFVNIYNDLAKNVELTPGIVPVLEGIKRQGVHQYVLSALKEDLLIGMLERFGIREYFEGVCGSNNIYADGKVARGMEMLRMFPIVPEETVMVGDTRMTPRWQRPWALILDCTPGDIIARNAWRRRGTCCRGWTRYWRS